MCLSMSRDESVVVCRVMCEGGEGQMEGVAGATTKCDVRETAVLLQITDQEM